MKVKTYIDDEEEMVIIHAHERTPLVNEIENLVLNENQEIEVINCFGYLDNDIVPLSLNDITKFYIENDKLYVSSKNKKYLIKKRLYQIEEEVNNNFIKINKSCIINKNHIKRFNTSWSGTLLVELDDNEVDYVSRRNIKNLKERMGL